MSVLMTKQSWNGTESEWYESCFRTQYCCLHSSSKYNVWWASWPLTLGTRAYDFELVSPIYRFRCVCNSEVLRGGLYSFYIPKVLSLIEVKFEVCGPVWVRKDWNQNPLNESIVSDSQTSTFEYTNIAAATVATKLWKFSSTSQRINETSVLAYQLTVGWCTK